MNTASSALCLLVALATTGEIASAADAAPVLVPDHYRVEAKVIGLQPKVAKEVLSKFNNTYCSDYTVSFFANTPGATCLSLPTVVVANRHPAVISSRKDANGDAPAFGVNLTVRPDLQDASVSRFHLAFARFELFPIAGNSSPIHNIQQLNGAVTPSTSDLEGYRVFELPTPQKAATVYSADGRVQASIADANERQLLFVKITRG